MLLPRLRREKFWGWRLFCGNSVGMEALNPLLREDTIDKLRDILRPLLRLCHHWSLPRHRTTCWCSSSTRDSRGSESTFHPLLKTADMGSKLKIPVVVGLRTSLRSLKYVPQIQYRHLPTPHRRRPPSPHHNLHCRYRRRNIWGILLLSICLTMPSLCLFLDTVYRRQGNVYWSRNHCGRDVWVFSG